MRRRPASTKLFEETEIMIETIPNTAMPERSLTWNKYHSSADQKTGRSRFLKSLPKPSATREISNLDQETLVRNYYLLEDGIATMGSETFMSSMVPCRKTMYYQKIDTLNDSVVQISGFRRDAK